MTVYSNFIINVVDFLLQEVGNLRLGPVNWFIPIFVACSTFGCVNGLAFSGARLVKCTWTS